MTKIIVFRNKMVEINKARYDFGKEEDIAIFLKHIIERARFTHDEIILEMEETHNHFTQLDKWAGTIV